jgi:hypothetical protein
MLLSPTPPVIIHDASEWNLANRALLSKYNRAIDALRRTVAPLVDEVKLDASDPLFTGVTPASFLVMLNDKLDSAVLGLEKGRNSLLEYFKSSFPITIVGLMMVAGPAKAIRMQVNLGTSRERPIWETFTINKKDDGVNDPSYALSCVTEQSPAYWQDLTGAFDDPLNDMCAGNSDLWVETKQRTKRGAYGEVHTTYAYTFSFKDASNVEKLVRLVSQRYAFAAEVRRGGGGAALLTASGKGDGMVMFGQSAA